MSTWRVDFFLGGGWMGGWFFMGWKVGVSGILQEISEQVFIGLCRYTCMYYGLRTVYRMYLQYYIHSTSTVYMVYTGFF